VEKDKWDATRQLLSLTLRKIEKNVKYFRLVKCVMADSRSQEGRLMIAVAHGQL
jgi:hypothetical protein